MSDTLTVILALVFGLTGAMNVLALEPARQLAAEVHYSVPAYRVIGAFQLAGAAGLIVGVSVLPALGVLAALGLLTLMGAAIGTHIRNGDPWPKLVPAVVLALLGAGYVMTAYCVA